MKEGKEESQGSGNEAKKAAAYEGGKRFPGGQGCWEGI
jgi:hypothetical protein